MRKKVNTERVENVHTWKSGPGVKSCTIMFEPEPVPVILNPRRPRWLLPKYRALYLLLLPGFVFLAVFSYAPMAGISLAFFNFQFGKPVWKMPFVGFRNFVFLFSNPQFWQVFRNTLLISVGRLVIEFPMPVVLALLLNEIRRSGLKRVYQTVYTFPHFLSWVIVVGILKGMMMNDGVVNQIIVAAGGERVPFFTDGRIFLGLIFGSSIWKEVGWGAIIYLAAISGINPELYDSAAVDGANRWNSVWHITWPGIRGTVVVLLILQVGQLLNAGNNAGFDQIFNMYNPAVYPVADIIDTYIYRLSFLQGTNFGYTTAVGLFKSVIAFILVVVVNRAAKLVGEEGLF